MSDVFEYRPKFVDIRVKKPDAAGKSRARVEPPPGQACDHIGCKQPGAHKAPKSRENSNEFWHFCVEHAADYNKRWNYFAGMSEGEFKNYEAAEKTGHRPTWTFRSGKGDRLSSAMRNARAGKGRADPFGMFGNGTADGQKAVAPSRRLTRMQAKALEAMSLGEGATGPEIRAKYAELVKRWHPDSNGGDRGAEAALQRVLLAYQTLKAAGLV